MSSVRNILFIMVDQMRADCLSLAGHPVVRTPNLDGLAEQGTYFPQTYVQTAVCGPSRMCFYTGRYTHAHRSYWNEVPLPIDEATLGTGAVIASNVDEQRIVQLADFFNRSGETADLVVGLLKESSEHFGLTSEEALLVVR